MNYGICDYCGKIFVRLANNQRFCDHICRDSYANTHKISNSKRGKKAEDNKLSLMEITRLAAQEHLTYGEYVAKHKL